MTCACGKTMEPIPGVGWLCLEHGDAPDPVDKTITIKLLASGRYTIEADRVTSPRMLRVLKSIYDEVYKRHMANARHVASLN